MPNDVLKRRIADALAHASSRDALATILREADVRDPESAAEAARLVPVIVDPGGRAGHDDCESALRAFRRPERRRDDADPNELPLEEAEVAAVLQHAADAQDEFDDEAPLERTATFLPEADTGDDTSLQAILDNVKDGIITVDLDGRILSVNSAAARLFAADADAMLDQPIETLLPTLAPASGGLAALAERSDDTIVDLSPALVEGLRGGEAF